MYKRISGQYFWHFRDRYGVNATVNEYIRQIAKHFSMYLRTSIMVDTTLDTSQYLANQGIDSYLLYDSYASHYVYISACSYGNNDQYSKLSSWLIYIVVFDELAPKLKDCSPLLSTSINPYTFPYVNASTAQYVSPNDEDREHEMVYTFPVAFAINKDENSLLPDLHLIGVGRMFTALAYINHRLKARTHLLDYPMGYFSYGRFTKWHIEENKRVIFMSCLYGMIASVDSVPFPKIACSIHICNELVYLVPDATYLRDVYWGLAATDGPCLDLMNVSSPPSFPNPPALKEGIGFQHMVTSLYRGTCDNKLYWNSPASQGQNRGTVVGHISSSPIRQELPVYEVAAIGDSFMAHNNLDDEMKLLLNAKRHRDMVDVAQIIYHPYFMILRQPEVLGQYSTIGECELYGEINAQEYHSGDFMTIKRDNDVFKYEVLKFDHQLDNLAFVFEVFARVKLLREIDLSNFDLHLNDRWRNFDYFDIEYGSLDGNIKKKVRWNIWEFESKYDSYLPFNLTKDDDYNYNIYQSRGDSYAQSDMLLREESHTGMIYSITGIRGEGR